MALIIGAITFYVYNRQYKPIYTAETTVAVYTVLPDSSQYAEPSVQIGKIFPYVLSSETLSDIIAKDLDISKVTESIVAKNIGGTNLVTITVRGHDADEVYNVLQSAIRNYPAVAQYVVGQTSLEMIQDSGYPTDTSKASVIGGMVRRYSLGGFLTGMIIVLLYSFSVQTIRSSTDLRRLTNLPCLGSLPYIEKKKRKRSNNAGINLMDANADDRYKEIMSIIRIRFERRLSHHGKHVIMVTSTMPGEGKSTVSTNLAISLAQSGRSVILVDCDLRNPSSRKILNISSSKKGLSDVLNTSTNWQDCLVSFEDRNLPLYILPGGKPSGKSELLLSEKMKQSINEMRKCADIILLDMPPSSMLADTFMLNDIVDGALYIIKSDYVKKEYILREMKELINYGIEVSGCIINGEKHNGFYRYGNEYGYGYYGARHSR